MNTFIIRKFATRFPLSTCFAAAVVMLTAVDVILFRGGLNATMHLVIAWARYAQTYSEAVVWMFGLPMLGATCYSILTQSKLSAVFALVQLTMGVFTLCVACAATVHAGLGYFAMVFGVLAVGIGLMYDHSFAIKKPVVPSPEH